MLIRNTAPVFGANRRPYQEAGEWQVSLASRNLVSNDHYNGTVEQVQRQTLQNYVTNRTVQVGTRWADPRTRRAIRLALEYYDGRNPFGGFVRRNEDWVGASILLDW